MTRLLVLLPLLLVVALLAVFGNRLAGAALHAELAPLLERQLGLPVTLGPVKAHLPRLRATSAKLVMGEAAGAAVRATDIEVELSWHHLLRGEIRFRYAGAGKLAIDPSRWPPGETPPPDYRFLAPWLPQQLHVASATLAISDGASLTVEELHWRRGDDGGATLSLRHPAPQGPVVLAARLEALPALLALRPVELALRAAVEGDTDSEIDARVGISPGADGGYELDAVIEAAGMRADVTASGARAWQLPERSATRLDRLDADSLGALLESYRGATDEHAPPDSLLDAAVPPLDLPAHKGHVAVGEVRIGTEAATHGSFEFTLQGSRAAVTELQVQGPAARLNGAIRIDEQDGNWQLALTARLDSRGDSTGLAQTYIGSRWLLHSGSAQLEGAGSTWGQLLYSLSGEVGLAGHYRAEQDIPIKLEGRLDTSPGEFGLEAFTLQFGPGTATGSAHLAGETQRHLSLDLQGKNLDLTALLSEEAAAGAPGIPVPDPLALWPGIDVSARVEVTDLLAPGFAIGSAMATLERSGDEGRVEMTGTGPSGGTLSLALRLEQRSGQLAGLEAQVDFERIDLPSLFRQHGLAFSRSSGSLSFAGEGDNFRAIVEQLQGRARSTLELRPDDDWQRPPRDGETLQFSGTAAFVLDEEVIVGVRLEDLEIDSPDQDITGHVSMIAGREPWLQADFHAPVLNLTRLTSLLPPSAPETAGRDPLATLRELGAARVSLRAAEFVIAGQPLHNMTLELASGPERLDITELGFSAAGSHLDGQASLRWQRDEAQLEASAQLVDFDLDQFLIRGAQTAAVPVSGQVTLESRGSGVEDLLANLTGRIDLAGSAAGAQTRRVLMEATREPDGMSLQVDTLHWGKTKLAGRARLREGSPPQIDVTVEGGTLSLVPWETAAVPEAKAAQQATGALGRAARASAGWVGDLLRAPLRLLGPEEEGAQPDERVFSPEPLPLESLRAHDVRLRGRLDEFDSTELQAKDIAFDGDLVGGRLQLQVRSAAMNDGTGELHLDFDGGADPPTLTLRSSFRGVRGLTGHDTYARSGVVALDSHGASAAELAGNASGLLYIRLGAGPFDYTNSSLFTADIATAVFRTLLPGVDRKSPRLICGTGLILVKDGLAATPYGLAARTEDANLVGRLQVDLKQEQLQLSFDSSSRQGVGISVGSVFSNAIQVRGPLSDPRVEPKTTSLLFRGWAAFMTAGLSIVGESVLKRALASENPCRSVQELIDEDLCPNNALAASSDLVCTAR